MTQESGLGRITVDFGTCPTCEEPRAIVDISDPHFGYLNQGVMLYISCPRCMAEGAEEELEIVSTLWARRRQEGIL